MNEIVTIVLSIIAIFISIASIIITITIWKSDRKNEWYWYIVIKPIREQVFKLLKLNEKITDKQKRSTEINRIFRIIRKNIEFLKISYDNKKIEEITEYIENESNKITTKMFQEDENYIECISNFEIGLYEKVFKLILNK